MCGLFGMAGNLSPAERKTFADGLDVAQVRGRDATGIIGLDIYGGIATAKALGTPANLTSQRSYQSIAGSKDTVALIGHVRHGTVGGNSIYEAHPFEFENVVGVHNGTLKGYYSMDGYKETLTDSECIFYNIDKKGVEATFEDITNDGAWAIVYYDKQAEEICFLRNKHRPLWFTYTKDCTTVFWASEPWMLDMLEYRGIELWEPKNGARKIFAMPTDTLWRLSVDVTTSPKDPLSWNQNPPEITGKDPEVRGQAGNFGFSMNRGGSGSSPVQSGKNTSTNSGQSPSKGGEEARPFPAGTTTTPVSSSQSTTPVQQLLATLTEQNTQTQPALSLTYRETKPSQPSQLTSSARPSSGRGVLGTSYRRNSVSYREVLGTWYVTHNESGRELTLNQIKACDQLGLNCSWCGSITKDVRDVNSIFIKKGGKFTHQCHDCAVEPVLTVAEVAENA